MQQSKKLSALKIFAGPEATQRIAEQGFDQSLFSSFVGASGGPKWFVLSPLDQALAGEFFRDRRTPINTLGSSIGSWRTLCYCMKDQVAALQRLEYHYMHQQYDSAKPTPEDIDGEVQRILYAILDGSGGQEILDNPLWHYHTVATLSRASTASTIKPLLIAQMTVAAMCNMFSRKALNGFFERAVFHTPQRQSSAFHFHHLHTRNYTLTPDNIHKAIVASASIPIAMLAVTDIPAAPGVFRDGGVVDYHFDMRFDTEAGLVFFPHFYSKILPGWYDKFLPWRRVRGEALSKVVMLSPSDEFVAGLPFGKIPDRDDFTLLEHEARIAYWQKVVDESQRLRDEFLDVIAKGNIMDVLEPFPE